jgi:hypothetical protein
MIAKEPTYHITLPCSPTLTIRPLATLTLVLGFERDEANL